MKALITYFSVGGTTKNVAEMASKQLGVNVFEIQPLHPYTAADIRYTNPLARCNKEKFGKKDVPVSGKIDNFNEYDTVFIGFPIWYGAAPNVVNTFCKEYDWTGKKVYAFCYFRRKRDRKDYGKASALCKRRRSSWRKTGPQCQ